jgi:hypothetical protein
MSKWGHECPIGGRVLQSMRRRPEGDNPSGLQAKVRRLTHCAWCMHAPLFTTFFALTAAFALKLYGVAVTLSNVEVLREPSAWAVTAKPICTLELMLMFIDPIEVQSTPLGEV